MDIKSLDYKYSKPYRYPVRLSFEDDKLVIYVFAKFAKSLLKPYKALKDGIKDHSLQCKNDLFTYADAICEGIVRNWNGSYNLPNGQNVKLDVRIIRYNGVKTKQRYLKFNHEILNKYSFVRSPFYRCIWGIFRNNGQFESFGLNWTPRHPGSVYLRKTNYLKTYEQTAAHEFGHVLGLGDAYGAYYRGYYEAPGTGHYMMNANTRVQPEEVAMMLKAQSVGKMQYFPRVISFENFTKRFQQVKARKLADKNRKQNEKKNAQKKGALTKR